MRVDYVTALTGVPLGVTLAIFMYALAYLRQRQLENKGLYVDAAQVRRDATTTISVLVIAAATASYLYRREPCRSSLFGGLAAGSFVYLAQLMWSA